MEQINKKILELSEDWNQCKNQLVSKSSFQKLEKQIHNLETLVARNDLTTKASDIHQYQSSDLKEFIRFGEMSNLYTKSNHLHSGNNESGGYLIQPKLHQKIVSNIQSKSPLRQLASIESISTNSLEVVIEDGKFESNWVEQEQDQGLEVTPAPKLKCQKIQVHELYAQPKATQKLLDDAEINVENWLIQRLEDSFVRTENHSFILGNGDSKPRGILHSPEEMDIGVRRSNNIDINALLQLMNDLDDHYHSNATWLMHRSTLSIIQNMRDNNGRFIWQPQLSQHLPQTIFSIPVVCASDMPVIESSKKEIFPIVLADFKQAYKIVDHAMGINIMRDPYTDKRFVKFYAVKRVGADIVNANAMKILSISPTSEVSPQDNATNETESQES